MLRKPADGERSGHRPSLRSRRRSLSLLPRGYEEGPVAEEAQARRDAIERGERLDADDPPATRAAVYGSTEDRAEPHFLGWADELDADELFESGRAWGLTIRK